MVVRRVDGDPVDPREEAGVGLEGVELAEDLQEHLLSQVFGMVPIQRQAIAGLVDHGKIPPNQFFKRLFALFVAHRLHKTFIRIIELEFVWGHGFVKRTRRGENSGAKLASSCLWVQEFVGRYNLKRA